MQQLHKRFTTQEIKSLLDKYLNKEIPRKYVETILNIKKAHFFRILKQYKSNPNIFSVDYSRTTPCRKINNKTEQFILDELKEQKELIENRDIPISRYNYTFIKDQLKKEHSTKISINPIISRAKTNGFYKVKRKQKVHDREVITNFAGELIQHDASLHLFAPNAKKKWTIITSIDDFSRFMLYAVIVPKETAWAHINAIKTVFLQYGVPLAYYSDSHSIFRFVRSRDKLHNKHYKLTDDVNPQWRQICYDCNVEIKNALSPQAKGKIERPYGWIQDHLVRLCVKENVKDVRQAQRILSQEVGYYNYKRIHSTIKEIPNIRFQRAIKDKQSLFRDMIVKPPFKSTKDIFSYRLDRIVDLYRTISIDNIKLKINAAPRQRVNLRILPIDKKIAEVRIWCHNALVDIQKIKISDLKSVQF